MLNLAEYRRTDTKLADYLPWACLVAPGVVLNKDGSFQRTFRYRGPDLDSATEAELISAAARLNNILKRFGDGWALFCEAERVPANSYPPGRFGDPASWLVDQERRAAFEAAGIHFEGRYHLTFLYLPPPDAANRTERFFYERAEATEIAADVRTQLAAFQTETERAFEMLAAILPEVRTLTDAETLTYLHGTISEKAHAVAVPRTLAYLDALLCDTPLTGGLEPKLGSLHLRVLTVTGFPNVTTPGLLDALNDLGFAYRWMTRWIPLDKTEAMRQLTKLRRHWFAKRKSVTAVLREVMFNRETALVDPDADAKANDADSALEELGSDDVAYGYLTATLVVSDTDPGRVDEKLLAVERIVNGRGFVTIRESLNAVEAWLGSLPGNPYANIRQPIVHTLNLVHMMPVSAIWAGPEGNAHLGAPPLMIAETRGSTPFRFDLHVGDVGHTLMVGPTGAGKSVLLATLALQFRRFIGAQVVIFDKGRSARAAALAMNGTALDLSLDGDIAFQPLKDLDRPGELAIALDWVLGLLSNEKVAITPEIKDTVWTALQSLASAPTDERTLTGLAVLIQSSQLAQALSPYTLEGPYGRLLDGAADTLALADVMHFEMDGLMHHKQLVLPVLTYLFHRLEARFDGRPTLLILDEAWVFLDDPLFAARIREWLKTLRKKDVAVVFATQSLADIERSSIAPAILESCPTRIFLPNDRAFEPQMAAVYERFGLNARQIEILARAIPKRDYYAQTARGNRLFELDLGPVALAFAATSSQDEQRLIDRVLSLPMPNGFGAAFLRAKGLAWAAEVIDTVPVSGVAAPAAAMPSSILATPNQPLHPQPPPIPPVIPKRIIPPMHPLLNSTAVNAVLPLIPIDPAEIARRLTPFHAPTPKSKRTRS
jgi:type IV secretion system protein TrbE